MICGACRTQDHDKCENVRSVTGERRDPEIIAKATWCDCHHMPSRIETEEAADDTIAQRSAPSSNV